MTTTKMFEKKVNEGDITNGLLLDSDSGFSLLPGFNNDNGYVEFYAMDEEQISWRFWIAGVQTKKPVILEGWSEFVRHYGLKVKDKVILYYNQGGDNGAPFVIHVRRTIRLFGVDITQAD